MKYFLPALLAFIFSFYLRPASAQQADSLLNFIKENSNRSSLYLIRNDTVIASLNENKMMPLASTMKILVALEFAKQAAFHVFDTGKLVSLTELNKYYLPLTDGNAHPQWVQYEKQQGHVTSDSVSLMNVARGMILFSSNANTEYLMDLLGLQNINSNYSLMKISQFTPPYYLVSSLFLYQNPKKMKEEKVIREIKALSDHDYIVACNVIHDQLKTNPAYKGQFKLNDLTIPMQRAWSERLPASTTRSYARIAQILNSRSIFNEATYAILARVLESIMENPANRQWLVHAGMKGGSTMFVLTKTLYATLQTGDRISFAYFFNDLEPQEQQKLQSWMNSFEISVLSDHDFARKLSAL